MLRPPDTSLWIPNLFKMVAVPAAFLTPKMCVSYQGETGSPVRDAWLPLPMEVPHGALQLYARPSLRRLPLSQASPNTAPAESHVLRESHVRGQHGLHSVHSAVYTRAFRRHSPSAWDQEGCQDIKPPRRKAVLP
ncbi:hypothetical protein HJG60_010849 [Phyllostomus discolor]|uniref:Uncharacterized protein n=1 Tax=Phyllostomus discolor TaxID=89673 RepID=A0A834AEP5_9CHIR|nr:hypothetical protein HJG60_010849 [Phyllostomus discolor]